MNAIRRSNSADSAIEDSSFKSGSVKLNLALLLEAAAEALSAGAGTEIGTQEHSKEAGEDTGLRCGEESLDDNISPSTASLLIPTNHSESPVLAVSTAPSLAASTVANDGGVISTSVYDGLAQIDPRAFVDKMQLARYFGVCEKTIRRRVATGDLPPAHMRIGRMPQWMVGPLLDWLDARARQIAEKDDARRQNIRSKTNN